MPKNSEGPKNPEAKRAEDIVQKIAQAAFPDTVPDMPEPKVEKPPVEVPPPAKTYHVTSMVAHEGILYVGTTTGIFTLKMTRHGWHELTRVKPKLID